MKKKRRGFWKGVEHYTNSLHVYCRLCKVTKNKSKALKISQLVEKTPLYKVFRKIVGREKKMKYERGSKGDYYEVKNHYKRYIGKALAIGFTIGRKGEVLVHTHGHEKTVRIWFDNLIARTIRAGALELTNHLKMLTFTETSGGEITRMVSERGYLKEWLKNNEMNI